MKPALITGASGFVGWHVARKLIQRGHAVRALVRATSRLRELDGVETITGDLRDAGSLKRAAAGCGLAFHIAADYRLWAPDPRELYESNVEGTRNLLAAALEAGVERVVYTSTVGCIGLPKGGEGDEETPVSIGEMSGPYKRSKFQAEKVALEFAKAGLPVVIVNPTAPVGDHDFKPTPTGKIILDFLKGAMPAFIDTGLNLVDVRDVAEGHLLACERGKPGERYILGCENVTLEDIFARLERISGVKAPARRIPYALAYAAGVATTGWASVTGREPRAPLDAVRMARKKMWVTHAKAARELGYAPGLLKQRLGARSSGSGPMGTAEAAKLLLVASEPGELRGILARSKAVRKVRWPVWFARIGELNGNRVIAIANGPGPELATAGIRAALERSRPEAVISTGFCGALDPAIGAGEVFVARKVEADGSHYAAAMPQTDGRFFRTGTLLSLNRVIGAAAEKAELRKCGAAAVDMEAGAVALEACRNRLPFYCIRAVLDRATEDFVLNFNFLRGADGRFSRKLILKAAMKRPAACLPELIRLGWRGRRASRALGEFLGNCEF